jgi:tRNA A-37 threonylcarbamoyl transferase component Bud32
MTHDDKGRAWVEGPQLTAILERLDEGGRSRAGDALLADALLISPDLRLRQELADRLIHRGDRNGARRLLEELARRAEDPTQAWTRLGTLAEEEGNEGEALACYEKALALDINQKLAKNRARRLRARREGRQRNQHEQRSLLARLLGAKAAGSRYAIVEEIGRGGAAAVFRARDRVLERPVALKIFHPKGRPQERRDRILAEARIAALFDHPHVVSVYDVDVERDLLVMSLCENGTLRDRMDQGRLGVMEMAEIAATLLATLADVHESGHLHLDVKPSNILFNQGRVLLGDFGAAGLAHRGAAAGTRAYMAPEQREGSAPGPAADLYALALVVFEGLSGRLPALQDGGAPPLTEFGPGPRRWALEETLGHCLRVEPSERPADLRAVAQRLIWAAALPADAAKGRALLHTLADAAKAQGAQNLARLEGHPVARWLGEEDPNPPAG